MHLSTRLVGLLLGLVLAGGLPHRSGLRAEEDREPAADFVKDVWPILQARCHGCHGAAKQKGDLRLDRKETAMKGGESGPVIVPGKSKDSDLFRRVSSAAQEERMPPTGERLTAAQLGLLRAWIDQGAPWPETAAADPAKTHWAFQPVVRPKPPQTEETNWARNLIDQFIAARLAKAGLHPAAEADRATLIRRLKFDLLGLPPTPEEVEAFVRDESPMAYEKLADRYLASPHFGERWARHWLDVVRFAESHGFETNVARPNAWPYRDYVIQSFNDDKPYGQFIREQLAGDKLGADEATGYLVGGAYDEVKGNPDLNAQQRADELHDMVSTTGSTFFGLTVGCARCHNHKFDPISQTDYYGMKAVFAGVHFPERPEGRPGIPGRRNKEAEELRQQRDALEARLLRLGRPPVNARKNVERFAPVEARFVRMTILETAGGNEPCIDELEVYPAEGEPRNAALASLGVRVTASGTLPGYDIHKLEHVNDGQYGNARSWISSERGRGWLQLEFPRPLRIGSIIWSRDRNEGGYSDRVATKYRFEVAVRPNEWQTVASSDDRLPAQQELEARMRAAASPMIYAGLFNGPDATPRLHRGDIKLPKELVAPAAPAAFGSRMQLALDAPEADRRLALAVWIADPKHPLTARVMANRLWQHHFGAGIVNTPSDFGVNGARPTHPELLDWLASEFTANGWRMKHLHRLIVLSSTYRQASTPNPKGRAIDVESRLLWRYPPRRLEAEALRDAILSVSGKLDLRMGGPGFDLFEPNSNYVKLYTPKKQFGPSEWRRMIYQSKPRMRLDDTFGVFDCPDAGQIAPRRTTSTTVIQMVSLLNSPFMLQQSNFFAERLRVEAGSDPRTQVRRGFWLAFQREPDTEETATAVQLIEKHGLPAFCRDLFNVNEFLYVD